MPSKNHRKRPMQPEDLYLLRTVSDVQLSPDGKHVAYTVSRPDKESDETHMSVHVAPVDGRGAPKRFTQGKRDHSPRWSPDGRYLAFVSKRGDDESQVFLAPLDGGEARSLTKAKFGAGQPAWSPDGKRIAYVARTGNFKPPKERKGAEKNTPRVIHDLRYRLDGVGYFDARRFHVFTIDVESGNEEQVTDGDWNDEQPAWSPDGKSIAFISDRERDRHNRQYRADVWLVPAQGGRARRLTRGRGNASQAAFSPDGRSVAFIGHEHGEAGGAKNSHAFVVSTGGGAPRSLSAALDRPAVAQLAGRSIAWSRDGRSVFFLVGDHGATSLYRAGVANGRASKVIGGERTIDSFALTQDGKRAVFSSSWLSEPGEVYVAPVAGGRPRAISDVNKEIRAVVEFAPCKRITYRAPDGLDIETFVLYPQAYRRGRYPLSLQIHGGPHSYHPLAPGAAIVGLQAQAAAGYVVLLPNPRGSQTYGEAFASACVQDWGGKDFEDLMAGVDLMVRRGIADPDRLYVGGGSYGGFMTQWAVGQTDRFRAAVVIAPVSEHISMFGTTEIPLFSVYEHGGTPWEIPELLRERSPLTYLPSVKTPVLLLHWEGDLRCPIDQSEQIFQGLRYLGKPVEFVRYPGGFHTVRTPSQEIDRMRRVIGWYDKHQPRRAAKGRPRAASPNGARPKAQARRVVRAATRARAGAA
jgi:dipeptidyl aminopeptidase/acylaminoacyl peptidase